ncbi:hypothetical protein NQ176_g10539 [Zarea fungicola]|uniref:Uncharacterized protein n=1 Tax=Zarea fungicola TaxID=93591 RepID=A0ACC1MFY7_9HYPO|nr:hypothetical protein NQ176_g10539 [Lecanicillium fungicola]
MGDQEAGYTTSLENSVLVGRLQEVEDALEEEVAQRLLAEKEKEELQESLRASEMNVEKHTDQVRQCQTALTKFFGEVDRTWPALADLRQAVLHEPAL